MAFSSHRARRNPDQLDAYVKFVGEADYATLPLLVAAIGVPVGHQPALGWMRTRLIEASEHHHFTAAINALDIEGMRQEAADRRAAAEDGRDARAELAAEVQADDDIRAGRRSKLLADVTKIRWHFLAQNKRYCSKEECLDILLAKDPPEGYEEWGMWHYSRSKNSKAGTVALYLGELRAAWPVMRPGSFIDYSALSGGRVNWADVEVLQPLTQQPDAQGRVRVRTNAQKATKLRSATHCLLEAVLWATGETRLGSLGLVGFNGAKYAHGLHAHDINTAFQRSGSPFHLANWQTVLAKKGSKRGANDGAARRRLMVLWDIISVLDVITLGIAIVEDSDGAALSEEVGSSSSTLPQPRARGTGAVLSQHAFVWDGWRRLLFIGPGQADDRGLDGALLLRKEECTDPSFVDEAHGTTVSGYVFQRFGIRYINTCHVLMVHAKRAPLETQQV